MPIYGSGSDISQATIWAANSCPGEIGDSLLLVYGLVAWEAIRRRKISRQSDRLARE